MQRITQRTLQPTAIHAVIGLQVANGGLHRCSPFEPTRLLLAQALELTPVNDLLVGVVSIHPAKAQINHDVFELDGNVLCQVGGLLQYGAQDMAVVRVAWEGAHPASGRVRARSPPRS